MGNWAAQEGYAVKFAWGARGAREVVRAGGALAVVDVLSFSTAVAVAVEKGTRVHPYRWQDGATRDFARKIGAVVASGRRSADEETPWSLSPSAFERAPATPALVLPSPNGSAIADAAIRAGDDTGPPTEVVAACLRNRTAAARELLRRGHGTADRPIAVVAAGEQWPDGGGLRPALEDLLGAGAVLAALRDAGAVLAALRDAGVAGKAFSPEARAAAAAFDGTPDIPAAVAACTSGLELARDGFSRDVALAGEVDATTTVPWLVEGAFTGVGGARG